MNLAAQDGGLDWKVLRGKVSILLPPLVSEQTRSNLLGLYVLPSDLPNMVMGHLSNSAGSHF